MTSVGGAGNCRQPTFSWRRTHIPVTREEALAAYKKLPSVPDLSRGPWKICSGTFHRGACSSRSGFPPPRYFIVSGSSIKVLLALYNYNKKPYHSLFLLTSQFPKCVVTSPKGHLCQSCFPTFKSLFPFSIS